MFQFTSHCKWDLNAAQVMTVLQNINHIFAPHSSAFRILLYILYLQLYRTYGQDRAEDSFGSKSIRFLSMKRLWPINYQQPKEILLTYLARLFAYLLIWLASQSVLSRSARCKV